MTRENDTYANYFDLLIEDLKDSKESAGYLSVLMADYQAKDPISRKILLRGLKNVIKARGGFEKIAESTGLTEEDVAKELFDNDNKQLETLILTLKALGLELQVEIEENIIKESEEIEDED